MRASGIGQIEATAGVDRKAAALDPTVFEEVLYRSDQEVELQRRQEAGETFGKLLPVDPPLHVNADDVDQRMAYSSIVALVNSKVRDFAPYFDQLVTVPTTTVEDFADIMDRLDAIKQLAAAMVQLKSPMCGSVDLSAFEWINELRGEEEVFTTLQYLLPEIEDLVKEFVELEG